MYSAKSYRIKQSEFNYLLPALRRKMLQSGDYHYIIAHDFEDLEDVLRRLQGHYDCYDELKNMVAYRCSINGSLDPFRVSIGVAPLNPQYIL